MNQKYIALGKSKINKDLYNFVNDEIAPNTGIDTKHFWEQFISSANILAKKNKSLLNKRDELQKKIDDWHIKNQESFNLENYKNFLKDINYLVEEKEKFTIETENVDEEISTIAGPQLVVPVDNARYALNAANARWGSLYDALYGTDAISGEDGCEKTKLYNPKRGEQVIKKAKDLLNQILPLEQGNWNEVNNLYIEKSNLILELDNKNKTYLKNKEKFVGYNGPKENPSSILLKNNHLHLEINIDPKHVIGKTDKAHISDIIIESAISTIMDLEDSVAAVDAEDKIKCYRNWLGIMKGTLQAEMEKNGKTILRKLNKDRKYLDLKDKEFKLHGRSLILVRNVGHLMKNPSIILDDGSEIPEGIMDAFITVFCAMHDFKNKLNSRNGSIYIVKPKMHGPEEVGFADEIFTNVEQTLKLKSNTIKIGIMDEERRTTVNLKECIRQAKKRIAFINTGFLDRTGDEMHTSFHAGPMIFKADMKKSSWLLAYENWNVDIGLDCGLSGKAQIGKGMWAMPDKMKDMLDQKASHPLAGANCAWVPSPTAATLHATHYHKINVFERQKELSSRDKANIDNILTIPMADRPNWSKEEIQKEIENNAQGILGYVVRWIDQGVGCSKVPDINNVGLMEDRATLRISSQHLANWIRHDIVSREQVMETLKRMAAVVDGQNESDPSYRPMAGHFDSSIAFRAACDLVFLGAEQPSGYTEPLLHQRRREFKASQPS